MHTIVVYESLWGNTAEVARAVAEGLGPDARALRTDEVTPADVESAGLVVAGAPVFGFKLSTERMREGIRNDPKAPEADLSCPLLRTWLAGLPAGDAFAAAFDTEARGPFGKGTPEIMRLFEAKGYRQLAEPRRLLRQGQVRPAARRRGRTREGLGRAARARARAALDSLSSYPWSCGPRPGGPRRRGRAHAAALCWAGDRASV